MARNTAALLLAHVRPDQVGAGSGDEGAEAFVGSRRKARFDQAMLVFEGHELRDASAVAGERARKRHPPRRRHDAGERHELARVLAQAVARDATLALGLGARVDRRQQQQQPAARELCGDDAAGIQAPVGKLLDARLRHQRRQALQMGSERRSPPAPEAQRARDRRLPAPARGRKSSSSGPGSWCDSAPPRRRRCSARRFGCAAATAAEGRQQPPYPLVDADVDAVHAPT